MAGLGGVVGNPPLSSNYEKAPWGKEMTIG